MMKPLKMAARKLLLATALPVLTLASAKAQNVEFFKTNYAAGNSEGRSVARGWDNNLYVTGYVVTGTGTARNADLLLAKVTPTGDTIWTRKVGLPSRHEAGYCVLTPVNNQIVIAATSDDTLVGGNAMLMSFDGSGNLQWQKTYPRPGKRTAVVDMKRLNNGYALCGSIEDLTTGDVDAWLLRTDLNGDTLWSKSYGGTKYDDAWQIEHTPDGGFMLGGGSYSYTTGTRHDDAWLVKTNGSGQEQWIKHYGEADTVDWIWSMAPVGNAAQPRGYIFVGVKNLNPNALESEMFLCRVDTGGNVVWDRTLAGTFNYREGFSVEQTYNNTFYVAASELTAAGNVALLAMNIDSMGNVLNELRYNSTTPELLRPRNMFVNNLSDVYITGMQYLASGASNAFLTRIRNIHAVPNGVAQTVKAATISVFPNPAIKECAVSSTDEIMRHIVIRDAAGRLLRDVLAPDAHRELISLDGLPRGIVFITVYTNGIAPVNLTLTIN